MLKHFAFNTQKGNTMLAPKRRARIIKCSIEFFAQKGFVASTRELAKYIGIT